MADGMAIHRRQSGLAPTSEVAFIEQRLPTGEADGEK